MPARMTRDRSHLTAKLAVAVTQGHTPDPNRATQLGMTAIDAAQRTGSARIMRELHTLDRELTPAACSRAATSLALRRSSA
jgi:hypothetical protein